MKVRRSSAISITLITCALALTAACGGSDNSNNAGPTNVNVNASRAPSPSPTVGGSLSTPANTFMTFYEASKRGDVEAVKRTLSQSSITFLTTEARKENKTLEAALTESLRNADVPKSTPEVRNERIAGDNATLEVKDEKTNGWDSFSFVRENGEWKLKLGLE